MKLKQLEMTLQRLAGFSRPRAALEQYQTPAPLAARLLYHALMKGDIGGKSVCDLGSGTGVLAIGAVQQVPVVENGQLAVGTRMKATISADHRVTDGAEAARFMQAFKAALEQPMRLML